MYGETNKKRWGWSKGSNDTTVETRSLAADGQKTIKYSETEMAHIRSKGFFVGSRSLVYVQ